MKAQSQALIDEKKKQSVKTFWLVNIGDIYFYTDRNETISYGNNPYIPWPVEISGFKSSDGSPLDGGTVRLGNVTLEMSSLVLNNLLKNKTVYVYEAWLDIDNEIIEVELICPGKIDGRPGLDEHWVNINVVAHVNPWTQGCPRKRITKANYPTLPRRGDKMVWGTSIITFK
jgi:hypothetical protein